MIRYAAKLLFQYRVMIDGDPGKRRTCEERIVVVKRSNAQAALRLAKRMGREGQHRYKNSQGNMVHFDFVGVMDLLKLGPECHKEEVWYDIVEYMLPMERKEKFIPAESRLNAIRHERGVGVRK